MPAPLTYPGVYIEEIPSGVRTITGVATSITAFIGRTLRGPTNEPIRVLGFGDFERSFGGLQVSYPMTYAVRDFFLNGGGEAIIVRAVHINFGSDAERDDARTAAQAVANATAGANPLGAAGTANQGIQGADDRSAAAKRAAQAVFAAVERAAAVAGATVQQLQAAAQRGVEQAIPVRAVVRLPTGDADLVLEAASEGAWANGIDARIEAADPSVGDRYAPLTANDLFNLTIRDTRTAVTERFLNLAVADSPRRVDRVLAAQSNLVRMQGSVPGQIPQVSTPAAAVEAAEAVRDATNAADVNTALADARAANQGIQGADDRSAAAKRAAQAVFAAVERAAAVAGATVQQLQAAATATVDGIRTDSSYVFVSVLGAGRGSDGGSLDRNDISALSLRANKLGIYALERIDLFNLLCIPPDTRDGDLPVEIYQDALPYCVERRAMLIVDAPTTWSNANAITASNNRLFNDLGLNGTNARNAAVYFPRVRMADPLREQQIESFVPCGLVAGAMARTDASRGVWKAPAGIDVSLNGTVGLAVNLTNDENGLLNPIGVNCLRSFPIIGRVVWGSRTLRGADLLADEYRYVPVRRLALFLEESLYRGTQWVVFEPNDEPLWAQIRLNVGAFMQNLFRQGAFQGRTPQEAYFVRCNRETTPQNDIDRGIVNIVVGFAPLRPAEFVVIQLQQIVGQVQT